MMKRKRYRSAQWLTCLILVTGTWCGLINADVIEDVQANATRKIMSLDGEWEISGVERTDEVVEFNDDPAYKQGWTQGKAFSGADKVKVPLNAFYKWTNSRPVWTPQQTTPHPLSNTSGLYGISIKSQQFFEGRKFLVAWYRRTFQAEPPRSMRQVVLHFGGVGVKCEVFVNGQHVGGHNGIFTAFEIDVSRALKSGENLVAVRCIIPREGEWLMNWACSNADYAGLWRSVHLIDVADDGVEKVLIDPRPADHEISYRLRLYRKSKQPLEIRTVVVEHKANSTVADSSAVLDAGVQEERFTMPFSGKCWSPEEPNLHRMKVTLRRDGTLVDEKEFRFGFRSFESVGDRLFLTGRPYRLMGWGDDGNHFGGEGYSSQQVYERYKALFEAYKGTGANAVRWHNPTISEQNRASDEVGYAVYPGWNESPWLEKWLGSDFEVYIRETIEQNYNHPSIVMWHFSNENWDDKHVPLMRRIYEAAKSCDTSGRPVIPDSGSYSFPILPELRGEQDVVDVHNYSGVSFKALGGTQKAPFTRTKDVMTEIMDRAKGVYGRSLPVILGESQAETVNSGVAAGRWEGPNRGGYHRKVIGPDKLVRPEIFEEIKDFSHSWADIGGGVKQVGLACYMGEDDHSGLSRWTYTEVVKDIHECYRLMPIAGIFLNYGHPWVQVRDPQYTLAEQSWGRFFFAPIKPIAVGLKRQVFSGEKTPFTVVIDGESQLPTDGVELTVRVDDDAKKTIFSETYLVPKTHGDHQGLPVSCSTPDDFSGPAIVRLLLSHQGRLIAENYYHISVTPKVYEQPIVQNRSLLVWKPGNRDVSSTLHVLDTLKIKYTLTTTERLGKGRAEGDWLCIPARAVFDSANTAAKENSEWQEAADAVAAKVKEGMNLLVLEQFGEGDLGLAAGMTYLNRPGNVTADPTVFDHPVLAGVAWHKWWIWEGNAGDISPFVMPSGFNTLAVIGAHADDRVYAILSEGTMGKGRVLLSQPDAVSRWCRDAAATLYLRELFDYALAKPVWKRLQPWKATSREYAVEDRDRLFCLDLKPYFNQTWADETPSGDGKGGWTDEGANDFSHFDPPRMDSNFEQFQESYAGHLADKAWLLGLPFDIPKDGVNAKSCIVVGAANSPKEVLGMAVGQKAKRIFFLGTATYNGKGRFVIHYEDGQTLEVPTRFPDWWSGSDRGDVRVAWKGTNPKSQATVSCFIQPWDNPHPDRPIRSIDLAGDHVVVLGVTINRSP